MRRWHLETLSCVMCHMSRVTCHMSCVICHIFFFFSSTFFGQSGEAYQWRVCYQWGLPRLVCSHSHNLRAKDLAKKLSMLAPVQCREESTSESWHRLMRTLCGDPSDWSTSFSLIHLFVSKEYDYFWGHTAQLWWGWGAHTTDGSYKPNFFIYMYKRDNKKPHTKFGFHC